MTNYERYAKPCGCLWTCSHDFEDDPVFVPNTGHVQPDEQCAWCANREVKFRMHDGTELCDECGFAEAEDGNAVGVDDALLKR